MKVNELLEGTVTQVKKLKGLDGKDVMVNMDKAEKISLLQVMAPKLAALAERGLKTMEKPSYWEDLDKPSEYRNGYEPWTELKIRRVEKDTGFKFPRVKGEDLYGGMKPRGPLATLKVDPTWDQAIVEFEDGTKYFADSTQASTYIRMWARVK